jgi:hypothetical protein
MLCIARCQARPLRWSAKPLAQSIRPLSLSSTLSFRPTPRFRQEEQPAPPAAKEKVEPSEYGGTFYEKVGKPRIRNQVLVSRVTFPLSNSYL